MEDQGFRLGPAFAKKSDMTIEAPHVTDPYRRGMTSNQPANEMDFGFHDLLDVVNPLQHLPGIGWLYREVTGDTMKPPAAIAGGALFGGPIGFAGAVLTAAFDNLTGGETMDFLAGIVSPNANRHATEAYSRAAALAEGPIQR